MVDKLMNYYLDNVFTVNMTLFFIFVFILVFGILFEGRINKIYEKHREILVYIIVGVLTTIVSIISYYIFRIFIPYYVINTILSWIVSVLFAFFANRTYVFKSKNNEVLEEAAKFTGSRLLTLGIEILLMFIMVTLMKIGDDIAKIVVQIVILVLNYIFSKLFVFKKV